MATVVKSYAVAGVDGFEIEVEAMTLKGQQQMFSIIGLGDQAVKEAGERIQAALEFCGYEIPKDKAIISLAPGDKRKRGSHYDLAMTIALLQQTDQISAKNLENLGIIGELSLNGRIRPCNGILPMVMEAKRRGNTKVILPYENQREAEKVSGIEIIGVRTLKETVEYLEGKRKIADVIAEPNPIQEKTLEDQVDFRDVKGQSELIEAILLAVAGGHNILMIGAPGCGKTMIAQRIPTILPTMTEKESLEVTKIYSISGLLDPNHDMMKKRPFRAPHHNISLNAMIGGGTYAMPGEVSLANNGVLFLDELAEYSRSTLESLRQPMEDKKVTISRVNGTNTFPANFMFVAAMNPCPCGYHGSPKCKCTDYEIIHYRGKISGPILERIDVQKNVKQVDYFELSEEEEAPSSEQLREIVERTREIQRKRFKDYPGVNCNAQMPTAMIQQFCKIDEECTGILKRACDQYGYSARVIHKLLRMARTSADMDAQDSIRREDIIRVLQCRDLDRSNSKMYVIS